MTYNPTRPHVLGRDLGLHHATIHRRRGEAWEVLVGGRTLPARQAASCLLRPETGDLVLLSAGDSGQNHILAVLERATPGDPAHFNLPQDAVLHSPGRLTLAPEQELNCVTAKIGVHAAEAEANIGLVELTTRFLRTQAERIATTARQVDATIGELVQRLTRSQRFVQEDEECQCANLRLVVEETAVLQSRETFIQAREQVKVDGETVQLG
ncbi:DUF3540 domain-containing protein [Desulfonatronum sp. SC1]|uniref:DUF3540 domain-containing protein n=1 Tax=Desulfonatronum sp. SC1 TaxID=2109626 RepID=UPI000D31D40E|nr:DUF3540 domain-containing protein [Desulfonatronum sp. SC1]PTN36722.1 hypothetical protein C6366_08725 [Desulfonatronum sp. SC1]